MRNTAIFRRTIVAASLLLTAALSVVSLALAPDFVSEPADQLAEYAAAGDRAWVSGMAFALAQLPFIVAVLGIGHVLRRGAPVLSTLGTCLAVLGAFGHSVFSGVMLMTVSMSRDEAGRETLAEAVGQVESSPIMTFAVMGLLGTVLGLVLLAIGLWRTRVGPTWVAPVLGGWVLVEFVGTGLSSWAEPLSGLMYGAALGGLAWWFVHTPEQAWEAPSQVSRADEPYVSCSDAGGNRTSASS